MTTDCNGTSLPDTWARTLVTTDLYEKLDIMKVLLLSLYKLRDLFIKRSMSKVGAKDDRDCSGLIYL